MFINLLFALSAGLTIISSIAMLVTKNIMHACIYLLGTLIGVAGLYATLGADFVAAAQLMVYVGGVVILMLFAIMLTGGKDFVSKTQKLLGLIPLMGNKWSYTIGIISSLVFVLINLKLFKVITQSVQVAESLEYKSTVDEIGMLFITDHVLVFEISSVLLLGALVGAAIIARPKRG
jgi:NADH:ubiquinone oxidoreductase subunit 6 (subunit J)